MVAFLVNANYGDLDYGSNDPVTIECINTL